MMDNRYEMHSGQGHGRCGKHWATDSRFNPAGLVIGHIMRDSHDRVRFEALTNKQGGKVQAVPVSDSTEHQRELNCLSVIQPSRYVQL